MKYITSVMLEQADACDSQRRLFETTFGSEAELTEANMAKAAGAGLPLEWLTRLLPYTTLNAYEAQCDLIWVGYAAPRTSLWETYRAQVVPLREAYEEQHKHLCEAHTEQKKALLWEAYRAQIAPLMEAYEAGNAPLWKAYEAQRNTLLLNTLLAA